jgi:RNA polymerase sigma factor (sigma-70 family)
VARHGPMVLGVCRRMLVNQADVDDAFQATFLVLVRKASHLGPRDAIGPWLYGVATRVALRARSEAARRRRLEPTASDLNGAIDDRVSADREMGEVIDQELCRLPSKYRHPIVLCYLEGRTHEEAARQLKWPIGTVKGRLSRARELLQSRLTRRGMTPAVGALALNLSLSDESWAAVHRELLDRTVKLAVVSTFDQTSTQVISASITSLVEGMLTSMLLNTIKWTSLGVLFGGLALSGVAVLARQDAKPVQAKPDEPRVETSNPLPPKSAIEAKGAISETVTEEKPLPRSERASIDDMRWNLVKAASAEWDEALDRFGRLGAGLESAYQASKRLMDADDAFASGPLDKITLVRRHLERIRELARKHHGESRGDSAQLRAYAVEAELWVAQAKTIEPRKPVEAPAGGHSLDGRGKDAKSQMILARLDEPISMSFNEDTPLEDVLKYIKQATTSKTYSGIPIYVDPLGLQEAEKSMTSTVRNMDLEGVPLRRTLQLMLKQIDLAYFVEDGLLYITSEESAGLSGRLAPAIVEPSPILQKVAKAESGELSLTEMQELQELLKTREQIVKLNSRAHAGETPETKETETEKHQQEQVDALLKELRGFVDELKAERQKAKAGETK